MATKISCPICKQTVIWNDDFPFRPFCSKRCQQIDFGDWATEAHAIPGTRLANKHFDEFSLDEMGIDPEGRNTNSSKN